ncbi:hypothetical protein [Paenibacillus sp. P22]|uniref:hypothetical protein n=1 Tax=Paenibacillus sp. P22 TaxID=483908 RepID=UPI002FC37E95
MKQRIVTGALAGALFLLLLVVGGQSYNVLLLLLALIGFYEYVRLNGFRPLHPAGLVGYAGMLFFSASLGEDGTRHADGRVCRMDSDVPAARGDRREQERDDA